MSKLYFEPMKQEEFKDFSENLSVNYAEDKIRAGLWDKEDALDQARFDMLHLLPKGVMTKDHLLWNVCNEDDEKVGTLWVLEEKDTYFIYDIMIFEAFQNQGYGSELLRVLEEKARDEGISEIELHVFGHNKRALHVYENMGFEAIDINMRKRL
ncbi:putative acetyltransferase [Listeria weihenstephanensis FSL R9-0317]|uniref:GNAT family N-acetyltransferase n=2 Tax=Listeria weihenstephanensis TaxID=1006155 RepID=A0A841Z6H8_9LIST|nr:GNAT family N-acetyltransferase [Listeria weihenstephanensis]EUJ37149.1 putative acetyltransferase [Listeria weihenstephanensis FSL R9-0317]MBC1500860.1 GNAT family N-acetyltransferase [Listeria weihenstephanensis]